VRLHVVLIVDEDLWHRLWEHGLDDLLWGASLWLQGLENTIFLRIPRVDSIICIMSRYDHPPPWNEVRRCSRMTRGSLLPSLVRRPVIVYACHVATHNFKLCLSHQTIPRLVVKIVGGGNFNAVEKVAEAKKT